MMRFFIVDDDENVVFLLKNIIKSEHLGDVIGFAFDGETAYKDIVAMRPDIVLIDYLMPKIDGAAVVERIKAENDQTHFIMLSQVSEAKMISEAYTNGVDFYIHKPINKVEVERVIRFMIEKVEVIKKLEALKSILMVEALKESESEVEGASRRIKRIQKTLSEIGIYGSKGASDIMRVCEYRIENAASGDAIADICVALGENPKIMIQRMRRSIAVGLRNLAHLGIEDNMHEFFIKYSSTLFHFEDVRGEMEMLRGRSESGGRVHVGRFIENLMVSSEEE